MGTHTDRTHVGRLGESPLAELLAHAYNSTFTGQLLLDCEDGARHSIGLERGSVCAATATVADARLSLMALGEALPSDTLRFVEAHAGRLGTDAISAARGLALLSEGALDLSLRKLVELRVLQAVALPESTIFAFFEGAARGDSWVAPSEPLEPFGLILKCLLVEPASDRLRRHLQPFEGARLYLNADSPAFRGSFSAPERHLIQRLRAEPQTVTELLAHGITSEVHGCALIHTLRLTH